MSNQRPFWKADPRMWELVVSPWVEGDREWPAEVVDEDLRWWVDQVSRGYHDRIPGRPALRKRWKWGDKRIRNKLKSLGSSEGPARVQRGSSEGPAQTPANVENQAERSSEGPARVQRGSSEGPQRVDTREQRTENRKQKGKVSVATDDEQPALTLVAPVAQPKLTDWDRLNTLYGSLPGCKKLTGPGKGLGRNLQRMLDVHGLQDAEIMLQWMAYAKGCPKADSLGESGHRVLGTVGRAEHVEGYWPHVSAWAKRGKPGMPDGRPRRRLMNGTDPTVVEGYDPNNPGPGRIYR